MSGATYSTPLSALDGVALDTETTGLDARNARVVQVGAVRVSGLGVDLDHTLDRLVNPGVRIPKAAARVHGINDEHVKGAPPFAQILPELETFLAGAVVIGHTTKYDLTVLERECRLANRPWRRPPALDVRLLGRLAAPDLAEHTLERLCEWLDIKAAGRHTALGDAVAAARIFVALVPLLRQRGIRTLAEAQSAARELADGEARGTGGLDVGIAPAAIETGPLARIDSFPYRHRVRDVMSAPPAFAAPDATVRQALRILLEKGISSLFVRDGTGRVGIVTERDALRELDARAEAGLETPLQAVMKAPLQTVAEDDFVYRAIGRITRLGFRHLGVHNAAGEIVGAVTTRNLLRHRASTAIMLGDEIGSGATSAALGQAWAKIPAMARGLLAEEVDPRTVAAVISSEICILTRRAAEIAEERMIAAGKGRPPVPYAVLVLGSAGRGESLLAADQDNAIVYQGGAAGGPEDLYFEALATQMCAILDEVGVVFCKGGVMAKSRAWRMSLDDWRATIEGWLRRQRPDDLLNVDIFFDAIPVHGERALGETIWNYAYERGHAATDFLKLLTEVARERAPAFTLLRNFKVDDKGRADLKLTGLMPLFTCARVLSIRHDVRARSTPERLEGVANKGISSAEEIAAVIEAHRTILGVVLDQQLADSERGIPLSPKVTISRLEASQKRVLRDALSKVDTVIDLVSEGRL